jgi:hypothetical protein
MGIANRSIRFIDRLRPDLKLWLAGAPGWGIAVTISMLLGLIVEGRVPEAHFEALVILFFLGSLLSWLVALPLIWFSGLGRRPETRFAASFLLLTLATVTVLAVLFALQYRLFYSQWHEPFGSRIWMFQFIFTSASAVYQFSVLGTRLLLPFGIVLIFGASLWLARRMR